MSANRFLWVYLQVKSSLVKVFCYFHYRSLINISTVYIAILVGSFLYSRCRRPILSGLLCFFSLSSLWVILCLIIVRVIFRINYVSYLNIIRIFNFVHVKGRLCLNIVLTSYVSFFFISCFNFQLVFILSFLFLNEFWNKKWVK